MPLSSGEKSHRQRVLSPNGSYVFGMPGAQITAGRRLPQAR